MITIVPLLFLPRLPAPFRICFASSHFSHLSSHFVNKIHGGEKKKKDKLRRRFEGLLLLGK